MNIGGGGGGKVQNIGGGGQGSEYWGGGVRGQGGQTFRWLQADQSSPPPPISAK